jgi:hypothetical protein
VHMKNWNHIRVAMVLEKRKVELREDIVGRGKVI